MEPSETVRNRAFIVNIINRCICVGLLARPYALMIVGWYSIISVLLAFPIITYTGYIFSKVIFKAFNLYDLYTHKLLQQLIINNCFKLIHPHQFRLMKLIMQYSPQSNEQTLWSNLYKYLLHLWFLSTITISWSWYGQIPHFYIPFIMIIIYKFDMWP